MSSECLSEWAEILQKVLFLKKILSVPCTMDSSFFSQQMAPWCPNFPHQRLCLYRFAFNPIPTGLCHVITVYGLIQPIAGRNRVKSLFNHTSSKIIPIFGHWLVQMNLVRIGSSTIAKILQRNSSYSALRTKLSILFYDWLFFICKYSKNLVLLWRGRNEFLGDIWKKKGWS